MKTPILDPKELDEYMSAKLMALSRKYPQMCSQYLIEMHKVISWGQVQLRRISPIKKGRNRV